MKLVALGSLVMSFELGCRVTSLNLSISVSLMAAIMKYVPRFLASGGMLVEYCVMRTNPTPRLPSSFKQWTKFFDLNSLVSSRALIMWRARRDLNSRVSRPQGVSGISRYP